MEVRIEFVHGGPFLLCQSMVLSHVRNHGFVVGAALLRTVVSGYFQCGSFGVYHHAPGIDEGD